MTKDAIKQANTAFSQNFESFKKQNLSKIYTYIDENNQSVYFYFFRGKKSNYYPLKQIKQITLEREIHEKELKEEFTKLKNKNG